LALDVTGSKDDEGAAVGVANSTNQKNQRWKVVYLDKAAKTATKGLNKEFGFHINRPFYLVSQLPFNRVAECIGANNIVIRDGERMLLNNNSSSMKFQRPSDQRHGPTMPWKSNQTEDLTILELHLVSLQDGGNCSKKEGDFIVNERGKRIEVQGNVDSENRNVVVTPEKHGKAHQQW